MIGVVQLNEMAARSLCSLLDKKPVPVSDYRERSVRNDDDDVYGSSADVIVSYTVGRCQRNNLASSTVCFRHVPSQIADPTNRKQTIPKVGDVLVSLMPVVSQNTIYDSIVDLYNSNVANGSALLARRLIGNYAGVEELDISCMPIHVLVSEWNKSLYRFHEMIRCEDSTTCGRPLFERRKLVIDNVTELAYRNVPVLGDHLWFAVHCIVSKPHLVKQVLRIVGSLASVRDCICHTGEVQGTTVPREIDAVTVMKLYLIAKTVPGANVSRTVLSDHSGVTLGLVWVTDEDDLHDHLNNSGPCHYLHIGTEYGNTFRCNGYCDWRYYNRTIFNSMARSIDSSRWIAEQLVD